MHCFQKCLEECVANPELNALHSTAYATHMPRLHRVLVARV